MRTVLAALAALVPLAPAGAAPPAHFDDAPLRAVQFVDRNEGWAVGDEGVVWHTIDGGATWERQATGVRASLRAVHFVTPYTGWVVGREELPGGSSAGVVLRTADGGITWEAIGSGSVPGLAAVHFFDDRLGLAAGDGSDAFPSGVYATTDAGRTWKPLPGPPGATWLAADLTDIKTGVFVGAWGRMRIYREGEIRQTADVEALRDRAVRGVRIDGKRGIAVGDGGLVLTSRETNGVTWGFAKNLPLPPEALAACDFHGVGLLANQRWVVGRPGTVVLHGVDNGKEAAWEVQRTGQTAPLNAVHFIDDDHGWAVGELGTILATADGGKTWTRQRAGGQRSAVMFLCADATSLPLDAAAVLGGEDGYLAAAVRVTGPDPATAPARRSCDPQRLEAAWRAAAGAAAESLWQFPMPDHRATATPQDLLADWDRLHGDKAAEQLLRQLVLTLRVWQPEVVVTDGDGSGPAGGLVAEAVREAVKRAADPTQFPEQLDKLGLAAWQPKKVYAVAAAHATATVRVETTEPRPHLSDAPREFVAPAAGLLADDPPAAPDERFFRLAAAFGLADADKHADLMQGTALAPGGTARRDLPPALTDESLAKALRARRTLLTLARQDWSGLGGPDRALSQLTATLGSLPADQAGAAAYAVGQQYAKAGQWHLAREVFLLMVERYPAHPRAPDAYRWLMRYHSSSEARRRSELGHFLVTSQTQFNATPLKELTTVGTRTAAEAVTTEQKSVLRDPQAARRWYLGSLEMAPRLAAFGPLYAADPGVQFPLAAARRQLGDFDPAQKFYQRFLALTAPLPNSPPPAEGAAAWRDAAAMELWLANRSGLPPKPMATCRQTMLRPFLDGQLDDPCWDGLKPVVLRPAAGETGKEYPTKARFAYDNEFLYVAVECGHPAGQQVPPATKRSHDADLRAHDRVSILLDLDRDYQTYYHFQIDQRGCVAEDCWGDVSWNPRWFAVVKSEPTGWTAELAIPLAELTGEPVTLGRMWAVNVSRVLPGRGVQAWSLPADVQPRPEGMGVLVFTQQPKEP
jgi:photosystem II stability/assembly factor-like uncharacterized protein/tetratricopeptide (TPR) repeat protein